MSRQRSSQSKKSTGVGEGQEWEVVTGPGYDDQAYLIFDELFASVREAVAAVHERQEEITAALELSEAEAARLAAGKAHAVDWDDDGEVPKRALVLVQPRFLYEREEPLVPVKATPRSRLSELAERAAV